MLAVEAVGDFVAVNCPEVKLLIAVQLHQPDDFFQQLAADALTHRVRQQIERHNLAPVAVILVAPAAVDAAADGLIVVIDHQPIQLPAGQP